MNAHKLKLALFLFVACVVAAAASVLVVGVTRYAIAVVMVVIPLVAVFVEPYIGAVIYLVYLYVRPHEFIAGLASFPLIMLLGGSAFVGMILHAAVYDRRPPRFLNSPQDVLVLGFFAAMLLSHLGRADLRGTVQSIDAFLPVLVLYFLLTNVVTTRRRLAGMLVALTVSAVVIAAIGIIEYHTGVGIAETARSPSRLSAVGWTNDPNILAVTLMMVVPFLILAMRGVGSGARLGHLLLLSVLLYAIYQTNSRGGMLTLGALLAVLVSGRYGFWKGLLAGAVMFVFIFKFGPSRMQEVSLVETSAHGRMISLADGLRAFWANPLFGLGAYGWTPKWGVLIPHCSFIRCAAEVGIIGLVAWVLLGLLSLRNLFFVMQKVRASGDAALGGYCESIMYGCGAFLGGSMFLPIPYYFPLYVFFALSAAATHVYASGQAEKYVLFERKDLVVGLLLAVGGLAGFEVVLRLTGVR